MMLARSLGRLLRLPAAAVLGALTLSSGSAEARDLLVAPGAKGQLAFDQISGFRATSLDGVGYAGLFGARWDRQSTDIATGGKRTFKSLSLWLAPSADYFVIDHLSLGGAVELTRTSTSVEFPVNANATQTVDLPTTLGFSIVPRVGYLIAPTNRIGIWPRLGIGYFLKQQIDENANAAASTRASFSGVVFDLDVGLLFRVTEELFLRAAPELAFSVAGSRSAETNNGRLSTDASFLQVGLSAGVGVLID